MPTVGRHRRVREDERWIDLSGDSAALFGFDRDEEVAILVLGPLAQEVTGLQRGDRRDRPLPARLRRLYLLRASGEEKAEYECQPPSSHVRKSKDRAKSTISA